MTGGEIVAVGKMVEAVGKKALAEDEKTEDALLRAAEGTPEMAAAARSMAARIAVKERVKLKLYQPFARMLGVSKAYFEDTFPLEMADKIADIPEENLITPASSVAVPALQGLSYTFEEASLRDMFLNLLATASDDRRAAIAHPAFAEIIKQLTPKEAGELDTLISVLDRHPFCPVARIDNAVLIQHISTSPDDSGQALGEQQMQTWLDNWQRLGLVEVDYHNNLIDYDWLNERPEFLLQVANTGSYRFTLGAIHATDFGKQFFRAVRSRLSSVVHHVLVTRIVLASRLPAMPDEGRHEGSLCQIRRGLDDFLGFCAPGFAFRDASGPTGPPRKRS